MKYQTFAFAAILTLAAVQASDSFTGNTVVNPNDGITTVLLYDSNVLKANNSPTNGQSPIWSMHT